MSAWVVSKLHIDALVTSMIQYGVMVTMDGKTMLAADADPTKLGKMLWSENVKSVACRYRLVDENPNQLADYNREVAEYQFNECKPIKPAGAHKVSLCYEYQSCEHDEWSGSEARAANDRLWRSIEGKYGKADYEAMPWGIDTPSDLVKITV